MKVAILSDLHLHTRFLPEWADYIVSLSQSVDRVILNGDFWDQYLCSFEEFERTWRRVLEALAATHTTYIVGNHDQLEQIQDRAWFAKSVETNVSLHLFSQTFHIEHGHEIFLEFNQRHPRLSKKFARFYGMYRSYVDNNQGYPARWFQLYEEKTQIAALVALQAHAKVSSQPGHWHIFGHTHRQLLDWNDRLLIPGAPHYPRFHYLLIDESCNAVTLESLPEKIHDPPLFIASP